MENEVKYTVNEIISNLSFLISTASPAFDKKLLFNQLNALITRFEEMSKQLGDTSEDE